MFRNSRLVTQNFAPSFSSSAFFKIHSSRLSNQTRCQSPLLQELASRENRILACILDFSGTMTDAYVIAPAYAFVAVFKKQGVTLSMTTARVPMGLRKDLHIQELCKMDEVKAAWRQVYGRYPDPDLKKGDAAKLFADFREIQLECIKNYGKLIPTAVEAVEELRKNKIKIGATTGFIREQANVLIKEAEIQGFKFDCTVTGDEVANGARPNPFMLYRNMDLLGVPNPNCVVKVDDTVSGIGEGLHAGCWTVGVYAYSNYVNINSIQEAETINQSELLRKRDMSKKILEKSGAHYVTHSIGDLPAVIADINHRLSLGESPTLRNNIQAIEENTPKGKTALRR